jgi:hypothetical protein
MFMRYWHKTSVLTVPCPKLNHPDGKLSQEVKMSKEVKVNIKKLCVVALVISTVAVVASAIAGTAAGQQGETQNPKQVMRSQSHVTNVAQAQKKGFLIITTSDGKQLTLKDSSELRELGKKVASKTVSPQDTQVGDCGESFIYLSGQNNAYRFRTGFQLYHGRKAVAYEWHVQVNGPRGYSKPFTRLSGLRHRDSWEWPSGLIGVKSAGRYEAHVIPGTSSAILSNGNICISLGPDSWSPVN